MQALLLAGLLSAKTFSSLRDGYVDQYFRMYPTAATQAGLHARDRELEHPTPANVRDWISENTRTLAALGSIEPAALSADDRLDAGALERQIRREIHDLQVRRRPQRDPLFWTEIIGNATVFLLVRDDRPAQERHSAAASRARLLPRLVRDAEDALSTARASEIAPELCGIAASQARSSARFYREGFPKLVPGADSSGAAAALEGLAEFLDRLRRRATGTPRLGGHYAETFRLGTGVAEPVASVLAAAERDLAAKRDEAAGYGRSIWSTIFPSAVPPADERELLRRLFARAAADRAPSVEAFVDQYRNRVIALDRYLREKAIVTLPGPLTLWTDRSPSFFVGQSVGGIYAAGPYSPDAKTLWFLPTPPDGASAAEKEAFFRDFNDHFNAMITPHETRPGHDLQLKYAAHHPRKVRALFADGVFVEGWGTFCERLMLDQGWGGPLDRIAHLKKQLENIARTIADIRVHTRAMTRDELIRFLRDDALQDEQFSSNMWTRAITSAPQLTFYYLGYREVTGLYEDVRSARGPDFRLRDFMDGMMTDGPVPVAHYREKMLGK